MTLYSEYRTSDCYNLYSYRVRVAQWSSTGAKTVSIRLLYGGSITTTIYPRPGQNEPLHGRGSRHTGYVFTINK